MEVVKADSLSSARTVTPQRGRRPSDQIKKRREIVTQFATKPSDLDDPKKLRQIFSELDKAKVPLPSRRQGGIARDGKYALLKGEPRRKILVTLRQDIQRHKTQKENKTH